MLFRMGGVVAQHAAKALDVVDAWGHDRGVRAEFARLQDEPLEALALGLRVGAVRVDHEALYLSDHRAPRRRRLRRENRLSGVAAGAPEVA